MADHCRLCSGSGDNRTGIKMRVNDDICPRCGGYGTVPGGSKNARDLTQEDHGYIDCNGRIEVQENG